MFTDLTRLVQPTNIAIIGVSSRDGSHGKNTYENIVKQSNFSKENVYLVNDRYDELFNRRCYKSISEIKGVQIDVAIILVRANAVPRIVQECADHTIPFALIMSSGFNEVGEEGQKLQNELQAVIKNTNIRVYGPNCPGLTDLNRRLGMTFSPGYVNDTLGGSIGLVTQGGGLGRTALQGQKRGIGFGYFFSPGNEIDLDLSDCIYYMIHDPKIKVIAAVAEGIKDGEKFKEVAKLALKKRKPIVILKVGRSELGRKAALSHTGSLAGSDQVFDALCKQFGVIRVNDIDELIETSQLFVRCTIREDVGLAIVTGSGGSGSLLADFCGLNGLDLPSFNTSTIKKLEEVLPPFASYNNPVDLTASFLVDERIHEDSMIPILEDDNIDIVIEPINADYGNSTKILAESLVNLQKKTDKVIIPIWMSSREDGGYDILEKGGLVPFRSIRNTVTALTHFSNYGNFVSSHVEVDFNPNQKEAQRSKDIIVKKRVLNEYDSKKFIGKVGIEVPNEVLAVSKGAAINAAESIGFPVAMKIVSEQIKHKTEVKGIQLNIENEKALSLAYDELMENVTRLAPNAHIDGVLIAEMVKGGQEMILGLKSDPQYGQSILIGMGGVNAEILKDIAIGICPISEQYAKSLVNELASTPLLNGYRNSPKLDVDALAKAISDLSVLGITTPEINELDINPLIVKEKGVVALDALVILD
ncbi:acyl-CoA synthetase [Sporosarcina sp. P21c]|uniref:acetate--CoA ligase family protein n=1 Tax=unclassified Sporosarcina TaxID=2647733 RepID=UPI000C16A7AC|nr:MULTISPECIES: acetate--CoA ligase family protein [unclassified Sporosarcina]PIC83102.1 acyl-CoA synthetase [Sporosarcina sp. P1]PIC90922.1 acyl-CoA synthetase [Sporosarcina sp. P21c]